MGSSFKFETAVSFRGTGGVSTSVNTNTTFEQSALSSSSVLSEMRQIGAVHPSRTTHDHFVTSPTDDSVPVFVMLPLDTIDANGVFKYLQSPWFHRALHVLVSTGVTGVAVDIWWGVVETSPGRYCWDGYRSLFELLRSTGLVLQVVLSFHSCGGNVGDNVYIPLPHWILQCGEIDPDIFPCDRPRHSHKGHRNKEYLSLFADEVPGLLQGRSPMECYLDFMDAFRDEFETDLGSLVVDIVIGAGPCGELRYPSYSQSNGWKFPGIGEFQCYDRYALASLAQAAIDVGHKEWGYGGPHNSGMYNNSPDSADFFSERSGDWSTHYGQFFLQWYSDSLLQHGRRLMKIASTVFSQKLKHRTFVGKSKDSIVSGMKTWLAKTGTRLCRSPSTSSGTDLCPSRRFSSTADLSRQSGSISSLLGGNSSEDSSLMETTSGGALLSPKEPWSTFGSMDGDYELLDVGNGLLAPVRINRMESLTTDKDSNQDSVCDVTDGGLKQGSTNAAITKRWDAGDFIRKIVSFLCYHQNEEYSPSIQLSLKIAGVHWWYKTSSHAAENTAGYFNTSNNCGYEKIVGLCKEFKFNLILTCVEMSDNQHPDEVCASPEGLLNQIRRVTTSAGVHLSGENALSIFHTGQGGVDVMALDRIVDHCKRKQSWIAESSGSVTNRKLLLLSKMHSFTFLRLVPEVLIPLHQGLWMRFMHGMQEPYSYLGTPHSSMMKSS
eukprot:g1553.t1